MAFLGDYSGSLVSALKKQSLIINTLKEKIEESRDKIKEEPESISPTGFVLTDIAKEKLAESQKGYHFYFIKPTEGYTAGSQPKVNMSNVFKFIDYAESGIGYFKKPDKPSGSRHMIPGKKVSLDEISIAFQISKAAEIPSTEKKETSLPTISIVAGPTPTLPPFAERVRFETSEPIQAGFGGSPLMMLIIFGFLAFAFSKRR